MYIPECRELFRRSLFVVGEFGGNDYGSTIFSFRPLEEVHALVPHVVGAIARGVEELIAEGAVDLVVPGLLPTGCFPHVPVHVQRQAAGGVRAMVLRAKPVVAGKMPGRPLTRRNREHAEEWRACQVAPPRCIIFKALDEARGADYVRPRQQRGGAGAVDHRLLQSYRQSHCTTVAKDWARGAGEARRGRDDRRCDAQSRRWGAQPSVRSRRGAGCRL
jgi:hypothetical protein